MSNEPRPKFTAEIARLAATEIIDSMIRSHLLEAHLREDSIADLAKHGSRHSDGYEIAKTLDSYCHWDCDLPTAEALDGFGIECDRAIRDAEKIWFARNNPQPPYPMGTRVRLSRGDVGTIDGIYEHGSAQYLVKVDGDKDSEPPHHSRRIINFEDATPEAEAA